MSPLTQVKSSGIEILFYEIEDLLLVMESLGVTTNNNPGKFLKKIIGHRQPEKFRKLVLQSFFVDTIVTWMDAQGVAPQVVTEPKFEKPKK